jgi:alkylated DNA repair dioxygenase AlkB
MDLFRSQSNAEYLTIPVEGGELYLMHDFLTPEESDFYFRRFLETIEWRQETLELYGKAHLLQRETAWYGDPETTYRYSGLTLNPLPWTPELLDLKKRVEKQTGDGFNIVLLNKYRSGSDKVGWHSDHEKEQHELLHYLTLIRVMASRNRGPQTGSDYLNLDFIYGLGLQRTNYILLKSK